MWPVLLASGTHLCSGPDRSTHWHRRRSETSQNDPLWANSFREERPRADPTTAISKFVLGVVWMDVETLVNGEWSDCDYTVFRPREAGQTTLSVWQECNELSHQLGEQ